MTSSPSAKYRGATVEDLDLPPALSISPSAPISTALAMAHDRDYSQLTVTSSTTRALLGYLSVPKIESLLQSSSPGSNIRLSDPVSKVMNRFDRKKGNVYKVITPNTTLEELEEFLKKEEFAVITDEGRKFVLGVATRGDLEEFTKRRPA
ncbi:hypothetical protein HOY82DRAFT_666961 [Tuber indicum]|nr:hypothetical protein HOY82DRAFT_666961 [Tuber indicum]